MCVYVNARISERCIQREMGVVATKWIVVFSQFCWLSNLNVNIKCNNLKAEIFILLHFYQSVAHCGDRWAPTGAELLLGRPFFAKDRRYILWILMRATIVSLAAYIYECMYVLAMIFVCTYTSILNEFLRSCSCNKHDRSHLSVCPSKIIQTLRHILKSMFASRCICMYACV